MKQASSSSDSSASGSPDSSAAESSESEDGSSSDDGESGSDNEEGCKPVKEKESTPKKRKAEEAPAAQAKKSKIESMDEGQSSNSLFVGSLSFNVDDEWLKSEFASFGCQSARVVWDRETGSSKG